MERQTKMYWVTQEYELNQRWPTNEDQAGYALMKPHICQIVKLMTYNKIPLQLFNIMKHDK
jgi:hypothetical protein